MPRSKLPSPVPDKAAAGRVQDNAAGFGLVAGIPPGRSYTITSMALKFTTSYLEDSLSLFRHYKKVAEGLNVAATRVEKPGDIVGAIKEGVGVTEKGSPFLLEFVVKEGRDFSRYA